MNVHRVDDGTLVVDNDVRYLGYDKNCDRHKVLTHGHPAYIEIIASGCLPTLYRYKGAADKDNSRSLSRHNATVASCNRSSISSPRLV